MMRVLGWTLFLVFVVALSGGCDQRKDVIPTKIEDKPLGAPKLPGAKEPGAKGGPAQ
jgi:hypothetical protein